MHDVALVQVLAGLCYDFEEGFGFLFLHSVLLFAEEIVVERVGASVLLDEVDICVALDDLDESCDDCMF